MGVQGLVLETRTLRNQAGTAAAARTQGLQVMTYGAPHFLWYSFKSLTSALVKFREGVSVSLCRMSGLSNRSCVSKCRLRMQVANDFRIMSSGPLHACS